MIPTLHQIKSDIELNRKQATENSSSNGGSIYKRFCFRPTIEAYPHQVDLPQKKRTGRPRIHTPEAYGNLPRGPVPYPYNISCQKIADNASAMAAPEHRTPVERSQYFGNLKKDEAQAQPSKDEQAKREALAQAEEIGEPRMEPSIKKADASDDSLPKDKPRDEPSESLAKRPSSARPQAPVDPEMGCYQESEKRTFNELLDKVIAWASKIKGTLKDSPSISPQELQDERTSWGTFTQQLENLLSVEKESPSQLIEPGSKKGAAYKSSVLSRFGSEKMSMDLSDYYETLPEEFQQWVPKAAPNLQEMIRIYENSKKDNLVRTSIASDLTNRISLWRNRSMNFSCVDCGHLFQQGKTEALLAHHIKTFHTSSTKKKVPWLFMTLGASNMHICPMLCGFTAVKPMEILEHMVLFHSERELMPMGFNRNYCKSLVAFHHSGEWKAFESPSSEQEHPMKETCVVKTSDGRDLEVRKEDKGYWERFGIL